MTAEGNVADTGILEEARGLIQSGLATTICEALDILIKNAKGDSVKIQKIKATQKSEGCRRRRRQ
jgi:hypothetical protein